MMSLFVVSSYAVKLYYNCLSNFDFPIGLLISQFDVPELFHVVMGVGYVWNLFC